MKPTEIKNGIPSFSFSITLHIILISKVHMYEIVSYFGFSELKK